MEDKKNISRAVRIVGVALLVVLIAVLAVLWQRAQAELNSATVELSELRATRDDTYLLTQIETLQTAYDTTFAELQGFKSLRDEDKLYSDALNAIKTYFDRNYEALDPTVYQEYYDKMLPLCTESAMSYLFPENQNPEDLHALLEPTEDNQSMRGDYKYASAVAYTTLYYRELEDGSANVLVIFALPYSIGDSYMTTDTRVFNFHSIYDAAQNLWLMDEIYVDAIITGMLPSDLK